jgi:DNA invertase Pin-like site-specific DNA recombinase
MKKVLYTRCSIEKEGSISHEMQLDDMMKLVEDSKYVVFSESNVSGDRELERRPVLQDALSALNKGDELIIWKMDRLCRDIYKLGEILQVTERKKVTIRSYMEPTYFEDNEDAEMMRGFSALVAKRELQNIRKRVKSALQAKKARGERVGYIPYGYCVTEANMIVPDDSEQKILSLMHDLYFSNGHTYRQVVEYLNTEGYQNREGRPWSHSSVHRILKNRQRHAESYMPPTTASSL